MQPDPSFGSGGTAVADTAPTYYAVTPRLVELADRRLLVGSLLDTPVPTLVVARRLGHHHAAGEAFEYVLPVMDLVGTNAPRQPHRLHAVWAKGGCHLHSQGVTLPIPAAQDRILSNLKAGTSGCGRALKSAPKHQAKNRARTP